MRRAICGLALLLMLAWGGCPQPAPGQETDRQTGSSGSQPRIRRERPRGPEGRQVFQAAASDTDDAEADDPEATAKPQNGSPGADEPMTGLAEATTTTDLAGRGKRGRTFRPGGKGREIRYYDGRVVPKDFLSLCAPQNTLKLPFWRSESTSIRLSTILPESRPVASGEVVATFQFADVAAREELTQQVNRLTAKRDESLLGLRKNLVDLEAKLEKARLKERAAEIDLGRKSTLSQQKQAILDIEFQLASHERASLEHKLAAARDNLKRTAAILDTNIRSWNNHFVSFDRTRDRFSVKAPAAGTLFYPTIDKQKRKIIPGDEISSGLHFLSVVTSDRVEIQFFVPEADLALVRPGGRVRVAFDGRERPGVITGVDFFPQRVGDVQGTFSLPNAWEKCFVVRADLEGPATLGTNNLVRVRLRP